MKLTVLVDNNTAIDQYYWGEPGACYYIEDGDERLLLDVGYSDIFMKNAQKMGIDLQSLHTIAISHGHDDHTRGLDFLRQAISLEHINLVAHPDAFRPKESKGGLRVGSPLATHELRKICQLKLSKEPLKLSERITFLGEVPSFFAFEERKALGFYASDTGLAPDYMADDTALVYEGEEGLFVITGCSHSGICNIIEYATQVCGDERVVGVIGGFHLFEVNDQVAKTIEYFASKKIPKLYPCHCVSLAVKAAMLAAMPIEEVAVGMVIEVE